MVVDAVTGQPLCGVDITNNQRTGTTNNKGEYFVRYYFHESDLRVFVSYYGYYTDTFSFVPDTIRLRPMPQEELYRQENEGFHLYIQEEIQKANNLHDSVKVYYHDFVYGHGGPSNPYFPEWDDEESLPYHTSTFSYSADSALVILYRLYQEKDKEHLYYPIVQLEHFLCRSHNTGIVPPDTAKLYLPLQSGTYADLGPGWKTNYRQHLLLYTEWALRSCEDYTDMFLTMGEPDLWHMKTDTALRMTVTHLPYGGLSLIRVFKKDGQPAAIAINCHKEYDGKKKSYNLIIDEREEKKLTPEQWQEIIRLATPIDTLPWMDKRIAIDGNRYQFEYRHDDSYHSHYTCFDHTGLEGYLFRLFEPEYKTWDEFRQEIEEEESSKNKK